MSNTRFFKFPPAVLLALLMFCSFASHAGTIFIDPLTVAQDAGTTGIGTTPTNKLLYTITNTGATNLSVTNVSSNLTDFIVEQPLPARLPVVILPGGAYAVSVAFTPTAGGTRNANITIASNDPAKPSTVVTATGVGGIEQSIRLTPLTPFEVELGQGVVLRANVTFTNGKTGIALLNWTSSNAAVATAAAAGDFDISLDPAGTPTGRVRSVALGTTTITVSSVHAPSVTASVPITIVPATPHEFMGTSHPDRIVRVKNGVVTPCYDFPEVDINGAPLYNVEEIGVTTPSFNAIGDVYVVARKGASDEAFFIKNCGVRTAVFNQPLSLAAFEDIVVESTGNAVASNGTGSTLWQFTPTGSSLIPNTGLPTDLLGAVDDVGSLAIDSFDNIYMSNLIKTATQQESAVYIRPVQRPPNSPDWFPIAAVFNTVGNKSSDGVPGMAAIYEDNKGYAMKTTVSFDRTIVERYIDHNGDRNFYNIVGTTILPDVDAVKGPEIVEVAHIDAGVTINVDANRSLIALVSEPLGRSVVKMTDTNRDGDFLDANEYKVIYQSTGLNRLQDIAFATPCRDRAPTAAITTLPFSGVVAIGAELIISSSSTDPCRDTLTYAWTNEDVSPATPICNASSCSITYTGLPALHTVGLEVTDPALNKSKVTKIVKVGPPVLNGFWPAAGRTGTGVFLFGKNFNVAPGTLPADTTVKFNNGTLLAGTFQKFGSDLIYVVQPAGVVVPAAGTSDGRVTLTTAIGTAVTSKNYNEVVPPGVAINGLWPSAAKKKAFIFVFGQGFAPGNVVTVNGVRTNTFQLLGSTLLIAQVPADPLPPAPPLTTGPVCVTVTGSPTACSSTNLIVLP